MSVLDLPNAMAVKVFDAIYFSGLLGSFFGSKYASDDAAIVWLFAAGVMRVRIAR